MSPRLLEGVIDVAPDARDQRIASLEAEVRELRRARDDAEVEATRAREDANRALSMLRKQLSPLYRALQAVFGELDAAGVTDQSPIGGANGSAGSATDPRWDSWKNRLGPNCAKVIDVLLLGGEMTVTGISLTAKMGKNTVYQATSKMGQAGILVRNGGKFSLKQL